MAAFFNLTLDTLAPQGVTLKINAGAIYTAKKAVTLAIGCSDASTAGYSMKIWGSIVGAATEADAKWENFSNTKAVTLTDGDGLKTVYIKVRDNVWNEAEPVSATITLNTAIPVITIVGPDVSIIPKSLVRTLPSSTSLLMSSSMSTKWALFLPTTLLLMT